MAILKGFGIRTVVGAFGRICLAAGLFLASCQGKPGQKQEGPALPVAGARARFADIVDSLQHVDPSAALEHYDSMLARDSTNYELYYEKGLVLEQLKDTVRALAALEYAFRKQPLATYALELAHLYAEKKDPKAIALCTTLIAQDADRDATDPFFIRGIYYANTAQYTKAVQEFDTCIVRDWKFSDAYLEKGIVQFKMKIYDQALKTFQTASSVSKAEADPYYWMGRCLEAKGKKSEAKENYEQAVSLDPGFSEAAQALRRVQG